MPVRLRLRRYFRPRLRPGHEFRAIQARIRDHFGGSTLALAQRIDQNHPWSGG